MKKISSLVIVLMFVLSLVPVTVGGAETGEDTIGTMNTHTSTVNIIPNILPASSSINFTAEVEWTGGPDPIHEFRAYEPVEFSNLNCDIVSGWYDPIYGYTVINTVEYYYCQWNAKAGNQLNAGNPEKDFTFSLDTPSTSSCRKLFVETRDQNLYYAFHEPDVCVDTTPPETGKHFDGPQKVENGVEWIDGVTEVVLTPVDPQPHPSGIDKTLYLNILAEDFDLGEEPCLNQQACQPMFLTPPTECVLAAEAECDGQLQVTNGGSWEDCVESYIDNVCFDGQADFHWQVYEGPFQKEEESCHLLQYYSIDNVGNVEDVNVNCFFVDKTEPVGTKEIGEPIYYENSESKEDTLCYKDGDNNWECYDQLPIALEDIGYGELPSGSVTYESFGPFLEIEVELVDMKLTSTYQLTLNGRDGNDGNAELANNCANPDGPKTGYDYAWECGSWAGGTGTEGFWNFDMTATTDGAGYYKHKYFLLMPNGHYGIGPTHDFGVGFIVKEAADVPGGSNYPPVLMETNGLDWTIDKSQPVWIRDDTYMEGTPVTLTCEDQLPHPSGDAEVCFRVSYDIEPWLTGSYCNDVQGTMQGQNPDDWCCVADEAEIVFHEDSLHDLEYYCVDAVEKTSEIDVEYFKVDSLPPVITKEMIGTNHLGDCPPTNENDVCYVADDGQNGVRINVADDITYPDCAVDEIVCHYELWWQEQMIDDGGFSQSKDIIFTEDSTHTLKIWCEDALGNSVYDEEEFLVDSTPPETTKIYGAPQKVDPECVEWCASESQDPEWMDYCTHEYCTWWITPQTPVTLESYDEKVGVETIYWRNLWFPNNDEICYKVPHANNNVDGLQVACNGDGCDDINLCHPEYYQPFADPNTPWNEYIAPFTKPEESCHVIEYYAVDYLGNEELLNWQCVFVDDTAPIGLKEVGDPSKVCLEEPNGLVSVDSASTPDPSTRVGDDYEGIITAGIDDGPCAGATVPGQCAYVNGAELPPFAVDTMIAEGVANPSTCDGVIIMSSGDPLDGDTTLSSNMGGPGCGTNPDGFPTYDCVQLQGYAPAADSLVLAVSSEWAEYLDTPFTDWMQVAGIVDVSINDWGTANVIPYGPIDSGTKTLATISANTATDLRVADSEDYIYDTALIVVPLWCFEDEPEPLLCGNNVVDQGEECDDGNNDNGDGCSSVCLHENGPQPFCGDGAVNQPGEECDDGNNDNGDGCDEFCLLEPVVCDYYVTKNTPIWLSCEDELPHPVGQETVWWRFSLWTDGYGGLPEYSDWYNASYEGFPVEVSFPEDSWHDLEFYCEDHLGNANDVDTEYFIVDTVAPVIDKTVVGPSHGDCPPEEGEVCFIDGVTNISVNAYDPGPHPVNDVLCSWEYDVYEGDSWESDGSSDGNVEPPFVIHFPEESRHELEITCWDALGNEYTDEEILYVDKTSPTIEKEYGEPYFANDAEWINMLTPIHVTLQDPAPHPSGVSSAEYRVTLVNNESCWSQETCQNAEGSGDFIPAQLESVMAVDYNGDVVICHNDHESGNFVNLVVSEGAAANHVSKTNEPDHLGDHYGQCGDDGQEDYFGGVVYCHNDHGEGNYVHKVSGAGGANNHVNNEEEPEMHLGDHYGPCTVEQFNFNIAEESCHLIEINAIDNVDKNSSHKQCVFVDNSPPEPLKTVADPKTKWDGADSIFYPEETAHCWDETGEEIECWRVTLDTEITLDCIDPDPHPVDNEITCFNVGLDGDDMTEDYCDSFGGEMEDNGYCCGQEAPFVFNFEEESEHNLKYYCEDALGNIGPIDEEKFKVLGRLFRIQLNKKWNLISVPFDPIDTNVEEVFKDVEENVEAVWSYKAETGEWFVYRPGELTNNLEDIKTGDGYWVSAYDNDSLLVGGSLYSPGPNVPPNRNLVEGWNLIGYYGVDDDEEGEVEEYDGPDGEGKPAYCSLYSIVKTNLVPKWSSLLTYWEPYNPDQWVGIILDNELDPGAGYWIHMKEDGDYAPSTACIFI